MAMAGSEAGYLTPVSSPAPSEAESQVPELEVAPAPRWVRTWRSWKQPGRPPVKQYLALCAVVSIPGVFAALGVYFIVRDGSNESVPLLARALHFNETDAPFIGNLERFGRIAAMMDMVDLSLRDALSVRLLTEVFNKLLDVHYPRERDQVRANIRLQCGKKILRATCYFTLGIVSLTSLASNVVGLSEIESSAWYYPALVLAMWGQFFRDGIKNASYPDRVAELVGEGILGFKWSPGVVAALLIGSVNTLFSAALFAYVGKDILQTLNIENKLASSVLAALGGAGAVGMESLHLTETVADAIQYDEERRAERSSCAHHSLAILRQFFQVVDVIAMCSERDSWQEKAITFLALALEIVGTVCANTLAAPFFIAKIFDLDAPPDPLVWAVLCLTFMGRISAANRMARETEDALDSAYAGGAWLFRGAESTEHEEGRAALLHDERPEPFANPGQT